MKLKKILPFLLALTIVVGCGESGPKVSDADKASQKQFGDLAAMNGLEKMKIMLQKTPSLVHSNINGKNQERPLHWAAWQGQLEVAKVLVARGAEINKPNISNHTPLDRAINDGKPEVEKYLISIGAKQFEDLPK